MRILMILTVSLLLAMSALRADGKVHNIKVVSDKVEDVTTLEAWKESFIKPGMSDREKGLAIWESCVKFRHQDNPPNEWTENEGNVRDPIKTFNVYGYGMCGCVASNICALGRSVGLKARGKGIIAHAVPELYWDGDWHLLDASLLYYFLDEGGDVASVDEICAAVSGWLAKNPGLKGNDAKLREFMKADGWTGWKRGPKMLVSSPFYDKGGWLPARTHGWYSTMQEYDGSRNFVYEYGYSMGYRALFRLRPGEVLKRNWFNKGLHVNMHDGGTPGSLKAEIGKGQFAYAAKYGDIAPGRVGNGTLSYTVPLGQAAWTIDAWRLANIKSAAGIAAADTSLPASAEIRMHCPYLYLTGRATIKGEAGAGGSVDIEVSTDNGGNWTRAGSLTPTGNFSRDIDISKAVFRRFDYLIRFTLKGAVTITGLELFNDIQHSQRSLPGLTQGKNTISVHRGLPTETITIAGTLDPNMKQKNEVIDNFKPSFRGIKRNAAIWCKDYGKEGLVTLPIAAPGDIKAVRFGGHFRARGERDGVELLLSFDQGTTWVEAARAWGPYAATSFYTDFEKVPAGVREVLVRYRLTQKQTVTGIFSLRVDVDYWDTPDGKPVAAASTALLKVTYLWEENGLPMQKDFITRKGQEKFTIDCTVKPVLKSILVSIAE